MTKTHLGIIGGIIAAQAGILYLMGQPWVCDCGVIKFWEGQVFSTGNSQQITDWYTFSHIIHGFLFYWLLTYLFPRAPIGLRIIGALCIEVGWELLENSPMIIDRYRQQALAVGYSGDSILNSISDSFSMLLGFIVAYRVRFVYIVAVLLAFELFTGFMIRDNLTLNIINLIYPNNTINAWQMEK